MFVSDKKWNVAYIHVVYSCSMLDKCGEGTLTIFMYYGVNIWCVRESPDLCSVGMFVSDKMALNSFHVLLHRHLSVVALCIGNSTVYCGIWD